MLKRKNINYSKARKLYLKQLKKDKIWVVFWQIALFAIFLGLWQLFSTTGIIDPFFFSSPTRIVSTIAELARQGNLWVHIWTSLYETVIGFLLASAIGFIVAVALWWSEKLRKILEPYLVILNS